MLLGLEVLSSAALFSPRLLMLNAFKRNTIGLWRSATQQQLDQCSKVGGAWNY
jgi:hypothetical protein